MTPSKVNEKVITERINWIKEMLSGIRSLPLESYGDFKSDKKNLAAAESYLRRALESLLDLGRHILAKGFGIGVSEYKQIARELNRVEIFSEEDSEMMRVLAGYRNRMVHFYHEISHREIYDICKDELGDIEHVLKILRLWVKDHPEMINKSL